MGANSFLTSETLRSGDISLVTLPSVDNNNSRSGGQLDTSLKQIAQGGVPSNKSNGHDDRLIYRSPIGEHGRVARAGYFCWNVRVCDCVSSMEGIRPQRA